MAQAQPNQASATCSGDLIADSVQMFVSSLREILQDKYKYKALLGLTGHDAQRTLDSIQLAVESHLHCRFEKAAALKAMIRLSRRSELCPSCFKITELQILGDGFIDEGSYGRIWKAHLGGRVVCAKVLRVDKRVSRQRLFKALFREALIWGQLSRHPNIVPFLGIRIGGIYGSGVALVSELMPNGNVVEYLGRNPSAPRMVLIRGIAKGLQHIHSLNIVHGDLKGINILIDSEGHARLADFGLANVLIENMPNYSSLSSGSGDDGGTLRWRAPELVREEAHIGSSPSSTPASDVYAFACTFYEILAGQEPFHDIGNQFHLMWLKITQPNLKPTRPFRGEIGRYFTDYVWQIMESGWNPDPASRPGIEDMVERLDGISEPEFT